MVAAGWASSASGWGYDTFGADEFGAEDFFKFAPVIIEVGVGASDAEFCQPSSISLPIGIGTPFCLLSKNKFCP